MFENAPRCIYLGIFNLWVQRGTAHWELHRVGLEVNRIIVIWFDDIFLYGVKNSRDQIVTLQVCYPLFRLYFQIRARAFNSTKHTVGAY